MAERRYYSVRTGRHPTGEHIDFPFMLKLFHMVHADFERKGYLQQAFGHECVDSGWVAGSVGADIGAYFLVNVRKDNLWPIGDKYLEYNEEDLFDVIEFLHDHVSKPVSGMYHDYGDCGWHYSTFNKDLGQEAFRRAINPLLKDYGNYELSPTGEVLALGIPGTEPLLSENIPQYDDENVDKLLTGAVRRFRAYQADVEDKRNAVRTLADVLEHLRPKAKQVLTKADERDLFELANSFGIRHHNNKQKTDYDFVIWLDWMFYYYLAAIDAIVKLERRANTDIRA